MTAITGIPRMLTLCPEGTYKAVKAACLKRGNRRSIRESNLVMMHQMCCVQRIDEERRQHNNQLHVEGKPVMEIGDKE